MIGKVAIRQPYSSTPVEEKRRNNTENVTFGLLWTGDYHSRAGVYLPMCQYVCHDKQRSSRVNFHEDALKTTDSETCPHQDYPRRK
jgi:hypothetical protein